LKSNKNKAKKITIEKISFAKQTFKELYLDIHRNNTYGNGNLSYAGYQDVSKL